MNKIVLDAECFLSALSFSLEMNGVPILVDSDGVIFVAPYGSTFNGSYRVSA